MEDDPEIPQYICSCCSRKLKSSYAFIKQAQKSNDRFLSLLTERQNCMKESEIDIDQCLEVKMESDDEEDQQPNVNSSNDVDDMQIKSELSDSHNSTEETKKESGSKTKVKEAKIRTE